MKSSLGIIGVGAFGAFMLAHLTPHFDVRMYDPYRGDLDELARTHGATVAALPDVAACDVVVIAVPVPQIAEVVDAIRPYLHAGQLVMDVGSVKVKPAQALMDHLPPDVDAIGLHPLFGPQSGKNGIAGLNITVVPVRASDARVSCVRAFLSDGLQLNVITCTAEEHDREMAYTQGLTHMIAKVFSKMNVPTLRQETKTYGLLRQMVDCIKDDSDVLFRVIQKENPYAHETCERFFAAVRKVEEDLG